MDRKMFKRVSVSESLLIRGWQAQRSFVYKLFTRTPVADMLNTFKTEHLTYEHRGEVSSTLAQE